MTNIRDAIFQVEGDYIIHISCCEVELALSPFLVSVVGHLIHLLNDFSPPIPFSAELREGIVKL